MTDRSVDWDCTAYGSEGREAGALCFFAELNERTCSSLEECRTSMVAERQRVFQKISALAAAGDPTAAYLEVEFSKPEQMLGGGEADPQG